MIYFSGQQHYPEFKEAFSGLFKERQFTSIGLARLVLETAKVHGHELGKKPATVDGYIRNYLNGRPYPDSNPTKRASARRRMADLSWVVYTMQPAENDPLIQIIRTLPHFGKYPPEGADENLTEKLNEP